MFFQLMKIPSKNDRKNLKLSSSPYYDALLSLILAIIKEVLILIPSFKATLKVLKKPYPQNTLIKGTRTSDTP